MVFLGHRGHPVPVTRRAVIHAGPLSHGVNRCFVEHVVVLKSQYGIDAVDPGGMSRTLQGETRRGRRALIHHHHCAGRSENPHLVINVDVVPENR